MKDAPRDRKQTRDYLVRTACKKYGKPVCLDTVEELVDSIMGGGSFIGAVDSLILDSEMWDS